MSILEPTKLLFIEDAQEDVELALREFARHEIPILWRRVQSEAELKTQIAVFKPHVVLSDFKMPLYDGWSALACVRAADPDLPFLFLSGTIGEENAVDALQRGAMDYVPKDGLRRLVPAVSRARREAAQRRESRRTARHLKEIVETSQDWLWELDVERRIVFTSPSVQAALGCGAADVLESDFAGHFTADERGTIDAAFRALGVSRRTTRFLASLADRDGALRWLETDVFALLDAQDEVIGFRGSSRDVTKREEQQHRILYLKRVLRMVGGVNGALVKLHDRDQLLRETCRIAVEVGGYAFAQISLVGAEAVLRVAAACGSSVPPGTCLPLTVPHGEFLSTTARAVLTQAPVIALDLKDGECAEFAAAASGDAVRAVVSLPLRVDQAVVGGLTLGAGPAGLLDDRELHMLGELADNVSFALQYLERQNAVHFLSHFDSLTGLAQRKLFCERLEQRLARRVGPEACDAVMVLDLERLGLINDSAGRHVGDGLLLQVADRLKQLVDDSGIAYLNGGIYALVLPMLGPAEQVFAVLQERVSGVFRKPFEIDGHTIRAVARYGIARYPDDGESAKSLLENAEAALKDAKAGGEDFVHYKMQAHRGQDQRLALEQRLRVAIEERQFLLHYQPKIDICSGRIVGLEALLRWDDPERGLVAPGEFLPVLEATHLIVEVGDRVIKQALTDLCHWAGLGIETRVAVNVSPWQLRRRDFVDRVLTHLHAYSVKEPCGLDVEITETALLQDSDDALRKLSLLRAAGVGVAIDDFGTGYSSLSRLALLPVDTIKIDRSFVSGLPASAGAVALVSTIIALARAFSLATVAEGVETKEQLDALRKLGCQQSQGYFHGRPQAVPEITALMLRETSAACPPARRGRESSTRA